MACVEVEVKPIPCREYNPHTPILYMGWEKYLELKKKYPELDKQYVPNGEWLQKVVSRPWQKQTK